MTRSINLKLLYGLLATAFFPAVAAGNEIVVQATAGNSVAGLASLAEGTLHINIDGLRSPKGVLYVSVFAARPGFPNQSEKAYRRVSMTAQPGIASLEFNQVPIGDYAVSVYHDENGNGRLDTNWLGIPAEGIGSSNNVRGGFGPPAFDACRFRHGSRRTVVKIHLQYL